MDIREAICSALEEEMLLNDKIFIIGEEVAQYQGAYKVTKGLLQKFGSQRVIDTPITEHGFAGLAIGAAFAGLRPVVEFMTFNFAMQAIDQIINSAAKTYSMSGGQINVPIVFRGPNGNAKGTAAQHSQCYASWYSHIPGLKVIAPHSAADHKGLLKSAIRDNNPVIFLENELLYNNKDSSLSEGTTGILIEIGKARIVQEGSDVTLVAFSYAMEAALGAVEFCNRNHISIELIDLRTLRPLDTNTILQSFKKTNRLVVVECGWPFAGIAAEISAYIAEHAFDYMDAPIYRVTAKDNPLPYAQPLERASLPSHHDVIEALQHVCGFSF